MRKIDLHLHTISTISDRSFVFSLDKLKEYIESEKLDAIAITNHNLFDRCQYEAIVASISIPVFPGIEVDIEDGHLLVITDASDLEDFCDKCSRVFRINGSSNTNFLTERDFLGIFGDLKKYILIPHYDKSPRLYLERIPSIQDYIVCGEVSSAKKFLSMRKMQDELVPVLFSDMRITDREVECHKRQTYIDVE